MPMEKGRGVMPTALLFDPYRWAMGPRSGSVPLTSARVQQAQRQGRLPEQQQRQPARQAQQQALQRRCQQREQQPGQRGRRRVPGQRPVQLLLSCHRPKQPER